MNRKFVLVLAGVALLLIGAASEKISTDLIIRSRVNTPGLQIIKGPQTSNLMEVMVGSGIKMAVSSNGNLQASGALTLSGKTNQVTVSAAGKLQVDGADVGGATIGDPFVVTSQLEDNETNVAMVIRSANPWTNQFSSFARIENGSQDDNPLWISSYGPPGFFRGNLTNINNNQTVNFGNVFTSLDYITNDLPVRRTIQLTGISSDNWESYADYELKVASEGTNNLSVGMSAGLGNSEGEAQWSFYIEPGMAQFYMRQNHTNAVEFYPSRGGGNYSFRFADLGDGASTNNTMIIEPVNPWSAGTILATRNAGTNVATIKWDGSITSGGGTNQWIFKGVTEGSSTNIVVNINGKDYTFQAW